MQKMPKQAVKHYRKFQESKLKNLKERRKLDNEARPRRCPYCGEMECMILHQWVLRFLILAPDKIVNLLVPVYKCKACGHHIRVLPKQCHVHHQYSSALILYVLRLYYRKGKYVRLRWIDPSLFVHIQKLTLLSSVIELVKITCFPPDQIILSRRLSEVTFFLLPQKKLFEYTGSVKKLLPVLILMSLLLLPSYALSFPAYDFTFYKTTDETLTSFNRNNVGIDVTGYGFVGEEATTGIYLRIGIQTPLKTLIKMKDDFLSGLFKTKTTKTEENGTSVSPDTTIPDTAVPNTAVPDTAVPNTAVPDTAVPDTAVPDGPEDTTPEDSASTPDTIISEKTEEDGSLYSASDGKRVNTTSSTEWRFLFSIGPAFRRIMTKDALVYAGLGVTVETQFKNIFTSSTGDIFSSFFARGSVDLDMGFRVGLSRSRTTIRIGFHAITNIIGFYSYEVYNTQKSRDRNPRWDIYGYIAGKDGIMGATTGWGYIRLATTFTERRTKKYSYSNRTAKTGGGAVVYID